MKDNAVLPLFLEEVNVTLLPQWLSNYNLWATLAHCLFLPIKFCWNTATPICLPITYSCFQTTMAELRLGQRLYYPQSLKYLLADVFQKKLSILF